MKETLKMTSQRLMQLAVADMTGSDANSKSLSGRQNMCRQDVLEENVYMLCGRPDTMESQVEESLQPSH